MPDDVSAPPLIGAALIKDEVRRLPDAPGVYRMFAGDGEALYVGKARSLKKRVIQYAQGRFHTQRIALMVDLTRSMEFTTTRTETDALLLEINLIKQLKPRFNVLLRDDKSFPEIVIRREHPAAQLKKHRGAHSIKGDYFGPFASAWAVNRTLNTLQKAFLLRSCSDSVYETRTRPCMLHQIRRCAAPCTGLISIEDYAKLVDEAEAFLRGKSRAVMARLAEGMAAAAEELEFERAARLRDRIRALSSVAQETQVNPETIDEADVFALFAEGGQACVQVFFFRAGQNWGNRPYFPRHIADISNGEVLGSFLSQFYDTRTAPALILLSEDVADRDLIAEALCIRSGRKVEIALPARGEKREIMEAALQNARSQFARAQAESASQRALLEGVAETFGLDGPPKRIEVYDNSHIQGANAVGAMVVAGPEGFQKSEYRKFNIKSEDLTPGDDIGMMREVLTRRFGRLVRESGEGAEPGDKWNKWPDLVLIDGGQSQVEAAHGALAEVGADDVVIVGVAKSIEREAGREHFHAQGKAPFRLDAKSPVLYYLQRLRDEAHRFAIGSHRKKRSKAIGASPLEEIPGVGGKRKKALLTHFGSARGVASASLGDLEAVEGVSSALARKIYDFFHTD